jgi:tubulin polyglutamylase TTLL4
VWSQIQGLIRKTLIAVEPTILLHVQKNPTTRRSCFELFGFDILLDASLRPWLLEVNCMPSLYSSSAFDKRIKTKLVCDALTLVGLEPYDKQRLAEENDVRVKVLAPFH